MNSLTHFLIRLLTVLVCGLPLSACATSGGPVEGKVLEEGTDKPVPDAIVVVRWQGTAFSFAGSPTVCIHVETATTDDQGRYRIPAWRAKTQPELVRNIEADVIAYKPGYQQSTVPSQKGEVRYLKHFTGGRGERFKYLDRVISGTSCGDKDTYRNLYRISYAVYEEARAIAQTDEERKRAESFKEVAQDALVNRNKPTKYDARGRFINVDPRDTYKPEDL